MSNRSTPKVKVVSCGKFVSFMKKKPAHEVSPREFASRQLLQSFFKVNSSVFFLLIMCPTLLNCGCRTGTGVSNMIASLFFSSVLLLKNYYKIYREKLRREQQHIH